MSIKGNLSAVKDGAIWGYAFEEGNEAPVTAYLYFDGEEIAYTQADKFRQGVLDQGIHPTGACGFTFSMQELKRYIVDGTRIQVRIGEGRIEIMNSPSTFNAPIPSADFIKEKKQVLVVGLPKSGTSILCYKIAGGLPNAHLCFEPRNEETLFDSYFHYKLTQKHPKLVTKCLFLPHVTNRIAIVSKLYEKKVWIYRDLRDRIISSFFFRWRRIFLNNPDVNISRMIDLLEQKEKDPAAIPFHKLMPAKSLETLSFIAHETIQVSAELDLTWFRLSYEDFIQGNINDLNHYLGFSIRKEAEVSDEYQMVARSKSSGDWRRWFTSEDVHVFRPLLREYLAHFGYDPADWELENPTSLPSDEGSGYIKKIVGQVLSQQGKEIPAYLR